MGSCEEQEELQAVGGEQEVSSGEVHLGHRRRRQSTDLFWVCGSPLSPFILLSPSGVFFSKDKRREDRRVQESTCWGRVYRRALIRTRTRRATTPAYQY